MPANTTMSAEETVILQQAFGEIEALANLGYNVPQVLINGLMSGITKFSNERDADYTLDIGAVNGAEVHAEHKCKNRKQVMKGGG